ncbi:hypothetical protein PsorP6_017374 [Peronosclerospora sorghi]|uniref:Uncharacterized protein n=1 Tax=Peronosclerospora sorghi TaxID=230839 RepID=A0ACC0WL68_9STRA|nr:hypothetical protein PsorP6_017374 [Peronosclerospora sorghi]
MGRRNRAQLRLLFEEARRNEPSIIFFDEIDGLAPVHPRLDRLDVISVDKEIHDEVPAVREQLSSNVNQLPEGPANIQEHQPGYGRELSDSMVSGLLLSKNDDECNTESCLPCLKTDW